MAKVFTFTPPKTKRPDGSLADNRSKEQVAACDAGDHHLRETPFKRFNGQWAVMRVCAWCGYREQRELEKCPTCGQPTENLGTLGKGF